MSIRNARIAELFITRLGDEDCYGSNYHVHNGKLYSYDTPIAIFSENKEKLSVNTKRFSVTTSKHQCHLNRAITNFKNYLDNTCIEYAEWD